MKPLIAGMQLYNILGLNQQVKVTASFDATNVTALSYLVEVEKNNKLRYICVSTIIYDSSITEGKDKYIVEYASYGLSGTNTGLKTISYA